MWTIKWQSMQMNVFKDTFWYKNIANDKVYIAQFEFYIQGRIQGIRGFEHFNKLQNGVNNNIWNKSAYIKKRNS